MQESYFACQHSVQSEFVRMAEAAVTFAIQTLGPLLLEEIKLLGGDRKEVERIKSELESLRSFLKDADARAAAEELEGGSEESVRTWVKQLRDQAYRIEDVIDEYTLMAAKLPHGSGIVGLLRGICRYIQKLKLQRGVATEIKDIKSSLEEIKQRGESYRFKSTREGSSSSGGRNVIRVESRVGPFFVEEEEVVGIETARDKLIDWLVNGTSTHHRSVLAVVGEGGLGKTTIAWRLFKNEVVTSHFHCQAWIDVGKEYNNIDLLRKIIKKFHLQTGQSTPGEICNTEEKDLITQLREHLKDKSYMVVFDDVWKIDFWKDVEHALFDNKKSSRVVLTTRRMDVADFCRSSSLVQVHELEPLPPNEAWKLFCRKAFGPSSGNYCPPELKKLSESILAKCGGLPLAISAIGGHLSSKKRVTSEWQKLLDGLGSKLGNDPHLKDCNRVLSEGYFDLPHHLKSCLLYFGLFPESCKISCARLIRLWIAEGFVQYSKIPTSEQVAADYMSDLVDRSLVQVSKRHVSGRATSCQVHDLMYEVILRKTKELGLCCVLNDKQGTSHSSSTRHVSIQYKSTEGVPDSIKDSKVRSVFLFYVDKLPRTFLKATVNNCKFMKVLDLEGAPIDYLPGEVGDLLHLHYLSLRNTKVKAVPKSIGMLVKLETLDLKHSVVSELPVEIKYLKKLRYLVAFRFNTELHGRGAKIQEGFGSLKDLQKLYHIRANSGVLKELGNLRQLRRLGIKLTNPSGQDLCASIACMENLESLAIEARTRDEILDLHPWNTDPPPFLRRLRTLHLMGNMKKLPSWVFQLKCLSRIGLELSGLTDDPITILQALPELLQLTLMETYSYKLFHFKSGWFPKLQKLSLYDSKAVTLVVIDKGAMPNLRELNIGNSPLLMEIPSGIEHLTNLKFLAFWDMLRQVYSMTKHQKWEMVTRHIPEIQANYWRAEEVFYVTAKFLSSLSPQDFEEYILIQTRIGSNQQSQL